MQLLIHYTHLFSVLILKSVNLHKISLESLKTRYLNKIICVRYACACGTSEWHQQNFNMFYLAGVHFLAFRAERKSEHGIQLSRFLWHSSLRKVALAKFACQGHNITRWNSDIFIFPPKFIILCCYFHL